MFAFTGTAVGQAHSKDWNPAEDGPKAAKASKAAPKTKTKRITEAKPPDEESEEGEGESEDEGAEGESDDVGAEGESADDGVEGESDGADDEGGEGTSDDEGEVEEGESDDEGESLDEEESMDKGESPDGEQSSSEIDEEEKALAFDKGPGAYRAKRSSQVGDEVMDGDEVGAAADGNPVPKRLRSNFGAGRAFDGSGDRNPVRCSAIITVWVGTDRLPPFVTTVGSRSTLVSANGW